MVSDSFQYNPSTCTLRIFSLILIPPNDVSSSDSKVDPPPTPPGLREIVSPVLLGYASVLS